MIFSYNYFSELTDINYYYSNKPLFLLNIKFFNKNYEYLYNLIQYICFNSYAWLNINNLLGNYDIINCWAIFINNNNFILYGLFDNIYNTNIYNTKIIFEKTNLYKDFLISQQLLNIL